MSEHHGGYRFVNTALSRKLICHLLGNVRKRPVSDVMTQRGDAHDRLLVFRKSEFGGQTQRDMADAQRVIESGVNRTRVHQVRQSQLLDPT
jgi:hypothetical protein